MVEQPFSQAARGLMKAPHLPHLSLGIILLLVWQVPDLAWGIYLFQPLGPLLFL